MRKKGKAAPLGVPAMACFALAAVLLAGGMVGSTRAALSVYSSEYLSDIELQSIGVALNERTGEDGEEREVSYQYYDEGGWKEGEQGLLSRFSDSLEMKVGETYPEVLTVTNRGTIPVYVRAYVYRYWTDADGRKDPTLDPGLIELGFNEEGWVHDEAADTDERQAWYYTRSLGTADGNDTSAPLIETIRVSGGVNAATAATADGLRCLYDGKLLSLEVEVDAIQAENVEAAAMSAWSRAVSADSVSDNAVTGSLELR